MFTCLDMCDLLCGRLERCPEDDEGRTFELDYDVEPTICNSTELRCRGIEMQSPSGAIKPLKKRRSKRANAQIQAMAAHGIAQKPKRMKYIMPIEGEGVTLGSCW